MSKYLNKYLIVILAIVVLIIFVVDLANKWGEIQTKHFDNGQISFDYPASWNEINGTGSNVVSFTGANGLNVTVFEIPKPPSYNLQDRVHLNAAGTINTDFRLVSSKNVIVNGMNGYEMDYNWNSKNGKQQRKEIWFEKNNQLYSIIYTAPGEISNNSGLNINTIMGSNGLLDNMITNLNITGSNAGPEYDGWAEIIMPDIHADWIFSSWSLNDVGAVYHIPTGYFPGERGQMALLGHHTTHSAPFRNIDKLKPGNQIIIKDQLTQKEYIYEVVSNGNDIRWGVEGEDIKYQATTVPELWLITCYPPGYAKAAWIVHCKLVSIEPLS